MNRARFVPAPTVQPTQARGMRPSPSLLPLLALGALALVASCGGISSGVPTGPGGDDGDTPQPDGGSGGGLYATGTELAVIELANPSVSNFIVRATVPIPPHHFPRTNGVEVFSIRGPDGVIIPAQNEVVSWYPNPADGADVVEVIARVNVPPSSQSAERLVFSVVWAPHHPNRVRPSEAVMELLHGSASLTLQARDVFGNAYSSDVLNGLNTAGGNIKPERSGRFIHQVALHDWLQPEAPHGGSQGTLPRLMGAHSYVSVYDGEDFISLDLRVHNGGSGLDSTTTLDDPLGEVFFEDLRLRLPSGWKLMSAVSDPFLGTQQPAGPSHVSYPIVKALPMGKLHLMPAQAQFQRRLVIYRDDPRVERRARATLREEGLAFVRRVTGTPEGELFSWWNQDTARYFPQNQRLPDLGFLGEAALRSQLRQKLEEVELALTTGSINPFPIVQGVMGWSHPWGPSVGGMQGGSEIHMLEGVTTAFAASNEGYRLYQRQQRMYACRQDDTLYNLDGKETCVEDWLETSGQGVEYLPVWVFLTPVLFLGDSFGFLNAPTFQQDAVAAMGLEPDYAALMRSFQPIDIEHMVRFTNPLKVLAWLGNDALAKGDLRMQAELMRLSYDRWPQTPAGDAIVTGMYFDSEFVSTNPGAGFNVNRGEGWAVDTMVAAYSLASPDWRTRTYPWFQAIANLFRQGQETCSGTIGSVPNYSWFGAQYRVRQSISAAILDNALWGTLRTVLVDQDSATREMALGVLERSTRAMISPNFWNDQQNAPYFLVATGAFDTNLPGFCGPPPGDGTQGYDNYQVWSSLAYGYLLTGDPRFLNRATEMAGGNLLGALTGSGLGELENRSAMLVLIQEQMGQL